MSRSFDRHAALRRLRAAADDSTPYDLVVVGGGITGAGVALDAAARGLRTALVERGDFASGTSSKSSKMVHGGLRYLQNGEVRLVYEALHERRRVMRNAPHLVGVLPFLIPIMTRDGVIKKKIARALGSAMWMYDLTGGWRIGRLHRRISAERAAEHFPTTDHGKLSAGYVYYDAGADDARLTLTIARTAAQRGADVVNHCPVVGFERDAAGQIDGVVLAPEGEDEAFTVPARVVVDATGVWADALRSMRDPDPTPRLRPAKGVHLTVPWRLVRNDIAVIIPSARDRRSVFLVPWGPNGDGTFRHTYVGTTDTDFDGALDDPQCDGDDIGYLLDALNAAIVEPVTREQITGVWSGLRPLVRSADVDPTSATADLSRRHVVEVGDDGVVSVNGGKLTTYRAMAEDTVDEVVRRLPAAPRAWRRHVTRRLALVGASGRRAVEDQFDRHLDGRYGGEAEAVRSVVRDDPSLGEPLVAGHPYVGAEVVHAVRSEMAVHLSDVLLRRTRLHLFDREAALAAAPTVALLMERELGWTTERRDRELEGYRAICRSEEEAARDLADATD